MAGRDEGVEVTVRRKFVTKPQREIVIRTSVGLTAVETLGGQDSVDLLREER